MSGRYEKWTSSNGYVQMESSTYPGFVLPSPRTDDLTKNQFWVGVFACDRGAGMEVVFQPFLRVTGVFSTNGVEYSTHSGHATVLDALKDRDLLVCQEAGTLSGRVTSILSSGVGTADSTSQLTLAHRGAIAANDYLLPAPCTNATTDAPNYKYLGSLLVDRYGGLQLRNFAMSAHTTYARMWTFFDWPNITSPKTFPGTAETKASFREHVPPLATGVVLSVYVRSSAAGAVGNCRVAHDSSMHEIGFFGFMNFPAMGGPRSNAVLGFGSEQALWVAFEGHTAHLSADMILLGWVEE